MQEERRSARRSAPVALAPGCYWSLVMAPDGTARDGPWEQPMDETGLRVGSLNISLRVLEKPVSLDRALGKARQCSDLL